MADKVIETEADELLRLLGTVPELSLPDAARRLHVPEKTVESICLFLEEEGIVSIQYKLTTPYISLIEKEETHIGSPEPSQEMPEKEVEVVTDLSLNQLEHQVSSFADNWTHLSEQQILQQAGAMLKAIEQSERKILVPPAPAANINILRAEHARALHIYAEIRRHYQMGERNVASDLMGDFVVRLKTLVKHLAVMVLVKQYAPLLPDNNEQVNDKIRSLVAENRFDEAEALYDLLKQKAVDYPKTFYKKELEFDANLSRLNQDLFSASEKYRSEKFEVTSKEMYALLTKAEGLLHGSELSAAEDTLRQLKQMLSELPDIHPAQKAELESRILRLSSQVLSVKGREHARTFETKAGIIQGLVRQLKTAIANNDETNAPRIYRDMKTHYESLPDTFPDRKVKIQGEILQAYQALTAWYRSFSEQRFVMMERQIETDLAEMSVQMKLGQMERAAQLYHKIKKAFYSLPQGDVQRTVNMQQKIVSVFEVFKLKYPQSVLASFTRIQGDIERELAMAQSMMAAGDIAHAWNQYARILELFKRLPIIGAEQRREIRLHILGLYRGLLQATDHHKVRSLGNEHSVEYERLLSVIMKFHDLVHEREFGQLEQTYVLASKLMGELPNRLSSSDSRVRREVAQLESLVRLYNNAVRIESLRKEGNNAEANIVAEATRRDLLDLRAQSPQDEELFTFVEERAIVISAAIERSAGVRGKAPKELPHLDMAMKNVKAVAGDEQGNIAGKIENLKKLAYPAVRNPTQHV